MKLSPVVIFLIILLVLALSIIFGKWLSNPYAISAKHDSCELYGKEGFLQYYGANSAFDTFNRSSLVVKIPQYSTEKAVHKLYDNIYYDPTNGAVIVLDGTQMSGVANDTKGTSITSMTLFERTGANLGKQSITSVPKAPNQTDLSKITSIASSYKSFIIVSNVGSNRYELVYIPWGTETFLHLIDLNTRRHLATFAYDKNGGIVSTSNNIGENTISTSQEVAVFPDRLTIQSAPSSNNRNHKDDSSSMVVPKYSSTKYLYQICENLKYDPVSGQMLSIYTPSGTGSHNAAGFMSPTKVAVYGRIRTSDRTPTKTDYVLSDSNSENVQTIPTPPVITNVAGFSAGVVDTVETNFTVLYIAVGDRTVLAAIYPTSKTVSENEYDILNVVRFNSNGYKDEGKSGASSGSMFDKNKDGTGSTSEYLQLLMYLQGAGGTGSDNLYSNKFTNDYMLKTQVVPPVCPTCPSCPLGSGVCTNCGGNGGSGTQGAENESGGGKGPTLGQIVEDTGSGTKQLLEETGSGATNLVRDAGGAAAGLGVSAVQGTVGLGKDIVGGTVGLGKDIVGGTVGLGKDIVGGTVGLAREAGSGIANTFGKMNPTQVSNINGSSGAGGGYQSAGSGRGSNVSTGADHTSYFGALPPKGANFIPVTADFSKFGR